VLLYLTIGWIGLFELHPLFERLGIAGLAALLLGAVSYTGGLIFYPGNRIWTRPSGLRWGAPARRALRLQVCPRTPGQRDEGKPLAWLRPARLSTLRAAERREKQRRWRAPARPNRVRCVVTIEVTLPVRTKAGVH